MNSNPIDQNTLRKQLAVAKKYRALTKHCGKKTGQVWKTLSGEKPLVVQYYPAFSLQQVQENALLLYKNSFGISPSVEEIRFVPTESVLGGLRIFYGDMMLDHSFLAVSTALSKDI